MNWSIDEISISFNHSDVTFDLPVINAVAGTVSWDVTADVDIPVSMVIATVSVTDMVGNDVSIDFHLNVVPPPALVGDITLTALSSEAEVNGTHFQPNTNLRADFNISNPARATEIKIDLFRVVDGAEDLILDTEIIDLNPRVVVDFTHVFEKCGC